MACHLRTNHQTQPLEALASNVMDPVFELALTLKAANRYLEQMIGDAMASLGITAAQADALVVIGETQPVSLKELGALLIAEAGHPSRLVDRLVVAGWVERRPADDDRRRIELSLTKAGETMRAAVQTAREDLIAFGRTLAKPRDVSMVLRLFNEFLTGSPYAKLLEKRRALAARSQTAPAATKPRRSDRERHG